MPAFQTRKEREAWYEEAAQAYLRRQSLEQIMEATEQATQREITLESLALVKSARSDVHVFNELLVQYDYPPGKCTRPRQVVPDNMVVEHEGEINVSGSYNLDFQPAPFWVLEYVSKHNVRKDYDDNMEKYENHLKVPYYLIFYPDNQELTLYRHNRRKYVTVLPNEQGRYPIPELTLELALMDRWVRFWFHGELLLLPGDLQRNLDRMRRQMQKERRRANAAEQRANVAELEVERLRAELESLRKQQGKS